MYGNVLIIRFSLVTERLKALLDPLLCSETPNVMHMQHYLCCNKIPNESKEQPSAKILSTYQVSYNCITVIIELIDNIIRLFNIYHSRNV